MRSVDCVGALIRDEHHRVYVQRRTAERRLLPGIWDIVGGHLEPGETPEQALAREVEEETGWKVRDIVWTVADWEWEYEGRVRRELDYLITIDGDLTRPRLEEGKHDAGAWVGPDDLDLLMVNRTDGDRRLRDIVAHVGPHPLHRPPPPRTADGSRVRSCPDMRRTWWPCTPIRGSRTGTPRPVVRAGRRTSCDRGARPLGSRRRQQVDGVRARQRCAGRAGGLSRIPRTRQWRRRSGSWRDRTGPPIGWSWGGR